VNQQCTCVKCGQAYEAPVQSKHRLICGDATDAVAVERLMGGQRQADRQQATGVVGPSICFTSPPYNVGNNSLGGNRNRVASKYLGGGDDRPADEYRQLLVDFTALALAYCQTVAINLQTLAGNKTTVLEWLHQFRDHYVDRMVWYKGQGRPAIVANVMNSNFEDVWIFSPEENPSRAIPTGRFQSTVSNVYEGRGASSENVAPDIHAASMPVHLALHVLESLDGTGGAVYEPFCGTGTTLIAAEQLGRSCLAVELVPQYVDVTVKRWQDFVGKRAVLERAGELLRLSNNGSLMPVAATPTNNVDGDHVDNSENNLSGSQIGGNP